jgi:hypothetical protein
MNAPNGSRSGFVGRDKSLHGKEPPKLSMRRCVDGCLRFALCERPAVWPRSFRRSRQARQVRLVQERVLLLPGHQARHWKQGPKRDCAELTGARQRETSD